MLPLMGFVSADAIYVSAKGIDGWSGTRSHPVATIARAIELAREGHVHRVVVGPGEYPQEDSITLDSRDSGLTIEAMKGARPLVTGAVVISSASIRLSTDLDLQRRVKSLDSKAEAYRIDLKSIPSLSFSPFTPYGFPRPIIAGPSELFGGSSPMTIARWPNEGFTTIKSVREPGNGEYEHDKPARRPVFSAVTDRAKLWKSIDNAWLFGYWKFDWADETIKLRSVDPQTGEITLETPHTYGVDPGVPFYVENLPEELDAVGEYYADPQQSTVDFVAESGKPAVYRLSRLGKPLITLNHADRVTLRGLDFAYSRGDGANLESCASTQLEGCRFYNLGERGAIINNGSDSGLEGCDVWNTGEGGVVLSGGDRASLRPAHLFVDNCDIHNYQRRSQTYRPGVMISGVGNRVYHCAIHDAPHSAIIFGGNDHVIEKNEFYRTISRTGDGGVVYTGRDWTARGTEIRYNYFHDNIGLSKWEPAIYFDDLASGLKAIGNVIERCHWGFLIGGGRDNLLAENKLIDCKLGFDCDARGLGWAKTSKPTMMDRLNAVPYEGSVWKSAYPSLGQILDSDPMAPAGNVIRDNLLIRSGKLKDRVEAPFDKTTLWTNNNDQSSITKPTSFKPRISHWGLLNDPIRKTLPSSFK